jgi:hypothetical protein
MMNMRNREMPKEVREVEEMKPPSALEHQAESLPYPPSWYFCTAFSRIVTGLWDFLDQKKK